MQGMTLDGAKKLMPTAAREYGKVAVRRAGVVSGRLRVEPDFLVIGTKRGGTTSFWNYLQSHPLVLPLFPAAEKIKSPHFFDINFHRGTNWYRSHFATVAYARAVARRRGHAPVTGEASPYYLYHPMAAERAAATLPGLKIIVLLRNPVRRAYSHYWERVGEGLEPLTFEQALAAEPERLRGEEERILADPRYYSERHDSYSYLQRGRYVEQLPAWLDRFPPEQVLLLWSEDFYRDPVATINRAAGFLGLPEAPVVTEKRYNYKPVEPMAAQTEQYLKDYYAPLDGQLADYLGRPLGWHA